MSQLFSEIFLILSNLMPGDGLNTQRMCLQLAAPPKVPLPINSQGDMIAQRHDIPRSIKDDHLGVVSPVPHHLGSHADSQPLLALLWKRLLHLEAHGDCWIPELLVKRESSLGDWCVWVRRSERLDEEWRACVGDVA